MAAIVADLEKHRFGYSKPVIPFIVPIRFVAENGDADDLRPINFQMTTGLQFTSKQVRIGGFNGLEAFSI